VASRETDDYELHLGIKAHVSGRKYLFFSFKGMLLAESHVLLTSVKGRNGSQLLQLKEVRGKNFMLMTTNRKATEVVVKSVGEATKDGVEAGRTTLAAWEQAYPEWARNVSMERRKSLPFLLPAHEPHSFQFEYGEGSVSAASSRLAPFYAWPADPPLELPLFDGLRAALGLFNHSLPFHDQMHLEPVICSVAVAPALRDLCITLIPQAKSEVEFVEFSPLPVTYQCRQEEGSPYVRCEAEAFPGRAVEKSFVLDSYRRSIRWNPATQRALEDRIELGLSGKKGNLIELVIELRSAPLDQETAAAGPVGRTSSLLELLCSALQTARVGLPRSRVS